MPGNESAYGSLAGMGAGALLGGPWGASAALLGSGLGGSVGGILGGLFGKKSKGPSIDIGAELAKINALFEQQKAAARVGINQDAAQARSEMASNLAARGTYSSPVSEYSFGRLSQAKLRALAESEASIGGNQAVAQANLFRGLVELSNASDERNMQREAALAGGFGSLAGGLLWAGLQGYGKPGSQFNTHLQQPNTIGSQFFPGANVGVQQNPMFPTNLIFGGR